MKIGDLCYVVRGHLLGRIIKIVARLPLFEAGAVPSHVWQVVPLRGSFGMDMFAADADLLPVMSDTWEDGFPSMPPALPNCRCSTKPLTPEGWDDNKIGAVQQWIADHLPPLPLTADEELMRAVLAGKHALRAGDPDWVAKVLAARDAALRKRDNK